MKRDKYLQVLEFKYMESIICILGVVKNVIQITLPWLSRWRFEVIVTPLSSDKYLQVLEFK